MDECPKPKIEITVALSADSFEIMEKIRDRMTRSDFLDVLLRMLDSNAISSPPALFLNKES